MAEHYDSPLPGTHPLTVGEAHEGICAVDLARGKGVWSSGQGDTHQKGSFPEVHTAGVC